MTKIDITKPVTTRDGRKVRCLTRVNNPISEFVFIGIIQGNKDFDYKTWREDGSFYLDRERSSDDLINAPEKKIVPLNREDMINGLQFRVKGSSDGWISFVTGFGQDTVSIGIRAPMTYRYLRENFEYSNDGGKTWQNCEKEV